MKKNDYMNLSSKMNGSKNNSLENPAIWGIFGIVVITGLDMLIKAGYRIRGGGTVGTGENKKTGWFDLGPRKGTGPAGHVGNGGRGRRGR